MNAKEALEALNRGTKVKTEFDSDDVFYQMYWHDVIARLVTRSYCTAETISHFTPEEFLAAHDGIAMVETNI